MKSKSSYWGSAKPTDFYNYSKTFSQIFCCEIKPSVFNSLAKMKIDYPKMNPTLHLNYCSNIQNFYTKK